MKFIVTVLLLAVQGGAFAVENASKLIVGITVANFYPEWLSMYKNDLGESGFRRLMQQGQAVTADYNYLFSQSGVDQATLYSGLLPAEHGIVSHTWFDRLRGKRRDNVADGNCRLVGDEGRGLSPSAMQALTLGCVMKMNNSFSKVYSIGVEGEEAVLAGGTCADLAVWLSETNGGWVTSDYYVDSLPAWLKAYNGQLESDFFIRRGWMSLADEVANVTALKLKSRFGLSSGFYYDLAQAKRKYDTYRILKATPYASTLALNLAQELIKTEKLGYDNDPDLLALNLTCLDYMNRDFDVGAREFQDAVLRLDQDLERLFHTLDERVGKGNYTVFLTFSEARELLPEELEKMRLSGGYFSIFRAVALLKSYLNLVYGEGEWVLDYDSGQIYLNRQLIEKKKKSLREVQDKVADFLVEFEGIARVITSHTLMHHAFATRREQLFSNSFSQKRSGDVLFALCPAWIPELKEREDDYVRYSKRNKVPLFLYGAGVPERLPEYMPMTSLLSVLCGAIRMPVPYTAD